MSTTEAPSPADRGSGSNDLLGLLPEPDTAASEMCRLLDLSARLAAEIARQREVAHLLATMLEDCAERLEFVCGGDDKVSTKYLKAAASVLWPNADLSGRTRSA